MSVRDFGNVPMWSTTTPTGSDPSTATLAAELIIPTGMITQDYNWEVRFSAGASTGALWRMECATSSGLGASAIKVVGPSSGIEQTLNFTGSNQTSEFVYTFRAGPGDRFRIVPQSSFTGTYGASIQAEVLT